MDADFDDAWEDMNFTAELIRVADEAETFRNHNQDMTFIAELIRATDEAETSRNPNPTPTPAPAPASTHSPPLRFTPPRELSQRPPPTASYVLATGADADRGFSPPRELKRLKVLSDPEKCAIYDQYGEEGLKGMPPPGSPSRSSTTAGPSGPSNFRYNPSDPDDFFAECMASNKTYSFDQDRTRFQPRSHWTSARNSRNEAPSGSRNESGASTSHAEKPPPVERTLLCTLEELYNGKKRKMKITRNVEKPDGRVELETEVLAVEVLPGWKKGTKITLPNKGNKLHGQLAQDLTLVLDSKPHDVYNLEGNNLLVKQEIPLVDALAGAEINLRTLDGRNLPVRVEEVVRPGYEVVVENEGWPIRKEPGKKGKLVIKFDVTFPIRLSSSQRTGIKRIMGG